MFWCVSLEGMSPKDNRNKMVKYCFGDKFGVRTGSARETNENVGENVAKKVVGEKRV